MLTERKLRQVIRKMIMEVTEIDALNMGRFDPMLNKMSDIRRDIPDSEKRVSQFKSDLGMTSDKSVNKEDVKANLKVLADLLGWQNFDPLTATPEAINNLIYLAIERSR
jgi:hypothetical protein